MNLNEAIVQIRVELQNSKVKKSGKNKFAGFEYYELSDFLPKLNELMLKHKVNDSFTIKNDLATLILIKGDEKQEYSIPFVMFDTPLSNSGKQSMQPIQYLGALNTYYKRYCYMNAFGITDGEVIDSMDNEEITDISPEQRFSNNVKLWIKKDNENKIHKRDMAKYVLSLYKADELIHIARKDFDQFTFDLKARYELSKSVLIEFQITDYDDIAKNNLVKDYYDRVEELFIQSRS